MDVIEIGNARIPAIGCGTWELRGATCRSVVTEALRIGYRHIDTAQGYENEREVGEAIRDGGVPRHEIFVTTKVRPQLIGDGALQRSVEESLERLQLAAVDLLLIHWPNAAIPLEDSMRALSDAKRRGLTKHIGVSNFTVANLDRAVALSPEPIVTNQVEYHPYLDQTKLLGAVRRHKLAITAYCPIAIGRVAEDPVLNEIAAHHGKTAVQVALRWLVQQGDVAAIPRTSNVARLKENLSVFDFRLTDDDMARVGKQTRPNARIINEPAFVPVWD